MDWTEPNKWIVGLTVAQTTLTFMGTCLQIRACASSKKSIDKEKMPLGTLDSTANELNSIKNSLDTIKKDIVQLKQTVDGLTSSQKRRKNPPDSSDTLDSTANELKSIKDSLDTIKNDIDKLNKTISGLASINRPPGSGNTASREEHS
jgi:prefoldin subunit 5